MQSFAIWVTTNCNMACTYCYEGMNKDNFNISDSLLEQTLLFIEKYMNSYPKEEIIVDFHGGEPLLQFERIKYAVNRLKEKFKERVKFGITTNGTIISEEIVKFLTDNFHYSLSISIDGNALTHDLNRRLKNGEGSYRIVIKNAKRFLEKREDIRIRMTVNSRTVGSLSSNVYNLINEGFKFIVPSIDYFDTDWDNEKMLVLQEQITDLREKIKNNLCHVKVGLIEDYKSKSIGICTGGKNSYHINSNGVIYPCAFVVGKQNYVIGNVISGLDNDKIEFFEKINKLSNTQCMGCSNESACISSRCKFLNKVITNDYYTPAVTVCNVENVKYKACHI